MRYDTERGGREVLVAARQFIPQGDSVPLRVEEYAWSPDNKMLLIFTNTQPVWRLNTRGDYWVLDRSSGRLQPAWGEASAKPSTLMFAKFSPDGRGWGMSGRTISTWRIWRAGAITPLTTDGSRTVINGTFDWVYEEELMNYYADGWRWSPDGRSIAYWQLNADQVKDFNLINNTDSLYSRVIPVQYPKAGEANSAARVGIVSAAGGADPVAGDSRAIRGTTTSPEWTGRPARTRWCSSGSTGCRTPTKSCWATPGPEGAHGADRAGQHLGGRGGRDSPGLRAGRTSLWVSERDGWNHVYLVSRDGKSVRLVTRGAFDVSEVLGTDEKGGWLYYLASPDQPCPALSLPHPARRQRRARSGFPPGRIGHPRL